MYIIGLNEIYSHSKNFGNKCYNLSFLYKKGFNVPNGFVIQISSEEIGDINNNINIIYNYYNNLGSRFVSVRSSNLYEDLENSSQAGKFKSYLNVTKNDLLEKIIKCFTSQINNKTTILTVLIQEMIIGDISGVLFTKNPISYADETIIEYIDGLCENIVQGTTKPYRYIINNDIGLYTEDIKINKLYQIGKKISNLFNKDVDIEWTIKDDNLFILQTRAISTLDPYNILQRELEKGVFCRMFFAENRPFIFSDIYLGFYKKHNILLIYNNQSWETYIPHKIISKTLSHGERLYTSKSMYLRYKSSFHKFYLNLKKLLDNTILNNQLSYKNLNLILNELSNFFKFYSKTEFFYTNNLNIYSKLINKRVKQIKNPYRLFFSKLFFGNESYLYKILVIIKEYKDIDINTLFFYSKKDLINLLKHNKYIDNNTIEIRKNKYVLFCREGKINTYYGNQVDNISHFNNYIISKKDYGDMQKQLINGTIISTGQSKGTTLIINADFNQYDNILNIISEYNNIPIILIVESATPDILYACNNIVGVITNQGGMLSHAAIFCREKNIPCIVGSGNANKSIENGKSIILDCNGEEGFISYN